MKCKLTVRIFMVRRLVRHFLHWLRQILAKFKVAKSRHPAVPKRPLPPARISQQFSNRQDNSHFAGSPAAPSAPAQERQPLPNPAANRAVNPSRFKVQLSDYQYSPSSDVQNLSYQLLAPDTQAKPSKIERQSIVDNISLREKISEKAQPNQTTAKRDKQLSELKFPPTVADTLRERETTNHQQVPTPLSLPDVETQLPEHTPTAQTTVSRTQPNVIVKQGVIKLLFKLKKNNHHGYVTPNDGSKDIIFHQKYIGDEVFCRLERGMAVEVTAHITEGKAYADHIQIL